MNQPVNPYSASSAEGIEEVFPQGEIVKLFRSYRSTWEITQFSLRISPNENLIAMERHGEVPQVLGFGSADAEVEGIDQACLKFTGSVNQSMGIICKTQQQAQQLFEN